MGNGNRNQQDKEAKLIPGPGTYDLTKDRKNKSNGFTFGNEKKLIPEKKSCNEAPGPGVYSPIKKPDQKGGILIGKPKSK